MGMPLKEIVLDIGGGIPDGKALKAIQTGGPMGGCLPESYLHLAVDYEALAQAGSAMGSGRPSLDIPMYLDMFMQGRLPLDKLVTRRYPLSEINNAFRALEEGEVIKSVVVF